MTASLPAKIATLPTPTPQIAQSLSQPELSAHRAKIAFEVRVMLHAHFDPTESDEVKAGLLAWFCDELQDWTHEQVVWSIRSWNRDNPRRRPTPGDLVALLKRARGEKVARDMAALPKPAEPVRDLPSPARRAEMLAEAQALIGGMGKHSPAAIVAAEIAAAASDHGVTEDEIRGYDRRPHIVAARDQAVQAASERGVPAAEIGRILGRDASTISHAIRKGAA